MSEFSRLLKLYRKRCCDKDGNTLSQENVSERLAYMSSTYGQWERGLRRPPERAVVIQLLRLFQADGGVKTEKEANELLVAASFAPLKPGELNFAPEVMLPQPILAPPTDATICRVFDKFPDKEFSEQVAQGQQIRILTTWIPLLDMFFDALVTALHHGARAEILMLHPASPAAELRSLAISTAGGLKSKHRVRNGVQGNLAMLADVAKALSDEQKARLQVRFYASLPSVLFYQVDAFCLAGFYWHGYMASYAPQLQVNPTSRLGQTLQKEFETLWAMGQQIENLA
ncbi:MAG: helix-turn-helix transcriptional regulator [Caldilineaceae bacterium]